MAQAEEEERAQARQKAEEAFKRTNSCDVQRIRVALRRSRTRSPPVPTGRDRKTVYFHKEIHSRNKTFQMHPTEWAFPCNERS